MTQQRLVIENLFQIVNKNSEVVPFRLNTAQAALDDAWASRIIIPKARQEGVSSYWLAYFTVECLSRPNTRAVVVSHETEATQRMLAKVEFFLDNLRGPKAVIETRNKNELSFPKTNSVFYIGTAGARKFGRGDTITHLLASELAYWPDPKKLASGLFQAVPRHSGVLVIESTGNGAGNYYHNLCVRALRGQSSFKVFFLPWQTFPEYRDPVTDEEATQIMAKLDEETGEPDLVKKYHLDAGQISFRRTKLEEFDYDLQMWDQEYPASIADCFQAGGASLFWKVNFVPTSLWQKRDQFLWALEGHPKEGRHYVVGGDVGAGVRKDNSVAEIFDLETLEQVGEWISNRVDPDSFARHLVALGEGFNEAYIGVESNNHGILTLSELKKSTYPQYKIHRVGESGAKPDPAMRLSNMGIRTTTKSKPLMVGNLRKLVKEDALIHSEVLKAEMSTFIEHEDGSIGAQEGTFDDTVMASAVALYIAPRAALNLPDKEQARRAQKAKYERAEDDPDTLDHYIASRERDRRSQYGIPVEYGAADVPIWNTRE